MKAYSVSFRVVITDKTQSYPSVTPIDLEVKENLPKNEDPQKYVRRRLAEELARAFSQLPQPIDNRDEAAVEDDPLQ